MAKTVQKFGIFTGFVSTSLSICESRKNNQAVVESNSGGLQSRTAPKRIGLCRKAGSSKRGLRKSSSLTNGMSPGKNKTALGEYGTEARCLDLSTTTCQCAHPGHPLMRSV